MNDADPCGESHSPKPTHTPQHQPMRFTANPCAREPSHATTLVWRRSEFSSTSPAANNACLTPVTSTASEPGAAKPKSACAHAHRFSMSDPSVKSRRCSSPIGFVRIHREHTVNIVHVRLLRLQADGRDWELKLEPPVNSVLPIARDRLASLRAALGESLTLQSGAWRPFLQRCHEHRFSVLF